MDMQSQIEYIEGRYNPENDAGIVTWCDMRLLALIEKLMKRIEVLEEAKEEREADEQLAYMVKLYTPAQ